MQTRIQNSKFYLMALLLIGLVFAFSVHATEVGVTNRTFASVSSSPIVGTETINFSVSGGEVLGASTPMRAYLDVEGLYTGGGTVTLRIDGDPASDQVFSLQSTSDPSPLSLVFGDKVGKLAATSAGTYVHSLTIIPSGVTLYGASVAVTNSYTREVGNTCPDGAPNTIKAKTVESWIAYAQNISGLTTFPIAYALNDNITGISNPVSSAYVEVTGLYQGSGAVGLYFNDPNTDGVTHLFQNANSPKQFTLLSQDVANIFSRSTGGAYMQNFSIAPSGVALQNVSLKFVLTYDFHPAVSACGGFPATGDATVPALDTKTPSGVVYNSITWRGMLGGAQGDKGKVRFQLATAPCANGATDAPTCSVGTWNFIGGTTCSNNDWFTTSGPNQPYDLFRSGCSSQFDGNQYYRYKVELCADDCSVPGPTTPTVNEIFVSFSP